MGFSRYFRFLIDISGYFKSLIDVSRYPRSLTDASRYLILMEFSRIVRSVESSRFFKYGVNISGNLRLIGLSKFLKFWFGVRAVHYKAFLLVMGGGK